ncbi:hypothetical protein J3U65_01515 [Gilliamella sp. B3791]|uniref:hypothetical protein n=1 Tax=unclassified Gilliamella TaxID=2685620 RepID=UPI00226A7EC8|nr:MULTISPECIES: hypothetical protein [unclassified Gilliamella]MCX8642572.1 hypothetical protein [Gilliamella sp. B3835]MCX8706426.1 hypothetical protein [Gilliamella sp. B3783]MCX8717159.1 hypothetical protein [Gilliamella sp. B3784]MCX8717956.1 hypothetical protein [Gilliamella sp. B3788]MCX8740360.1 hypothetical protein [Gilliamella sp. B3791]
MKIDFLQLYAEVGVCYEITDAVLNPLIENLNELNKTLPHYDKLFKTTDYELVFTISATQEHKNLVYGPTTSSKNKVVYFTIFIPYKTFSCYKQQMFYVLDTLAEGMIFVFNKYKTDPLGIKEVFETLKTLIAKDPERYQKWLKDLED